MGQYRGRRSTGDRPPWRRSAVLEYRFALLDKRGHPLGGILGLEREGRNIGLDLEPVMQRQIMRAADRVARQAEDGQAEPGHVAGKGLPGGNEIAVDDAVDEADALRF